jgi:hypothetical protein
MKTEILRRLSDALLTEYHKLTDEEKIKCLEECRKVTPKNCFWCDYQVANMFRPELIYEVEQILHK